MTTTHVHTKLKNVVVYDFDRHSLSEHFLDALRDIASEVTIVKTPDDFSGMLEKADLRNVEAIISRVFDDFSFLAHRAPLLRYVGTCHTDTSHFPLKELESLGVTVTNVPGYAATSVAELTLGMLLSLSRHIPSALAHVHAGGWDVQRFMGRELAGRTLGIVGPGAIGGRIAKAVTALEMNVVVHSRSDSIGMGYPRLSLEQLLSSSDVVVISIPLNASTRGLLSREHIGLLKPDSTLLVPARCEIFDCQALLERCVSGTLTVWLDEVQDQNLREAFCALPNVFLTPDYGWLTREALKRQENQALKNILRWRDERRKPFELPIANAIPLSTQRGLYD
jgi:phosphoglycerate dehydrogenase-like enzyme